MIDDDDPKKDDSQDESIIKFPCEFVVKIMGKNNSDFEDKVLMIIRKHFASFGNGHLEKRLSKNNQYLSISATVFAKSKAELDALYKDLTETPEVIMAL